MKIKCLIIVIIFISLLTSCTQSSTKLDSKKSKVSPTPLVEIDKLEPNTQTIYDENSPLTKLDVYSDTWNATDSLGRKLPTFNEVGDVKKDKFVGLFFWTWHITPYINSMPQNINDISTQFPEEKNNFNFEGWGKDTANFWNEPLFGYYTTTDKYVLRKQAELLANAGVDVILFDTTNGSFTWKPAYTVLMEVFTEARAQGVKTPKIAFVLNLSPNKDTNVALKELYNDIYKPGKHNDLWFYWDGKPLIMAYPDILSNTDSVEKEIKDFFTFRPGQGSYNTEPTQNDQWGWLGIYPQKKFGVNNGKIEQMTVGVAQNWNGGLTAMNGDKVFGRSYSNKNGYDTRPEAKYYGINFQEQWDYAISQDPEFIFITGWNEWTAGRYEKLGGVKNAMFDTFNDEYSRDIEPTKGDLKDNYYYQMVSNIRRFKGVRQEPVATTSKTINVLNNSEQWLDVLPEFKNYEGSIPQRKFQGYGKIKYTNDTGRNDVISSKVSYDKDNIYFMVQTAADLSPKTDPGWMRLYIDTPVPTDKNWEGFEYVINRINPEDKAVLEVSDGGWKWSELGKVDYSVEGKVLQIAIPLKMLGLNAEAVDINFKWSDNMQEEGNLMDFYVNGEAAPGGRYTFHYTNVVSKAAVTTTSFNSNIVILIGSISLLTIVRAKKYYVNLNLSGKM